MELKCLNQVTSSVMLATLTAIACIARLQFFISELKDTANAEPHLDRLINILLYINLASYVVLIVLSLLLIYATVKKRHVLMIPWFVAASVSAFSEVCFVTYVLAKGHSKYVLFLLIGTVITLWIMWSIFSLYKVVRTENLTEDWQHIRCYLYSATRKIEIY